MRRRSVLLENLAADQRGSSQPVILDELRRVILDGAAPPGTPIPLAEVAEYFGVSHIPVREALRTLIGEDLVAHRPNAGYAVARLTAQELRELYIVRASLEQAALAAATANADDADRAAADGANTALQQAIRDDDAVAYHRQSRHFHLALTRPSRMHRLLHMLETAWNATEPVQPMVHVTGADRARLQADHRDMLAAFLDDDVDGLLAVSQRHAQRLTSLIASLPAEAGLIEPP